MDLLVPGPSLLKDMRFALGLLRQRGFDCLVQVTNRCNMRCSFCEFWPNGAPANQELSLDEFRRLGEDLRQLGCFIVSLEGGEPFVRPDLVEIVRIFGEHHLPALYTNGWYVTAENARALFDAGLVQVGVSIDYPDERHDEKRGLEGALERAWRAVDLLREAAPHGGKQVHVMTVFMESNWRDLGPLLEQTKARGVGHVLTLLTTGGDRRGQGAEDALPPPDAARHARSLWRRYPHLRYFQDYLRSMETFLEGGSMPTCRAGLQTLNVDHVGNVSACIERIDKPVGNLRQTSLSDLHARLVDDRAEISACQECWTACRGLSQALGRGGSLPAWRDLGGRMRSH